MADVLHREYMLTRELQRVEELESSSCVDGTVVATEGATSNESPLVELSKFECEIIGMEGLNEREMKD